MSVKAYLLLWFYDDDVFCCCQIIYSSFSLQILNNFELCCEDGMVCLTNSKLGCPFEMSCSNSGVVSSLSSKGGDYPGLYLLALILD
jgi:hypothetical protein